MKNREGETTEEVNYTRTGKYSRMNMSSRDKNVAQFKNVNHTYIQTLWRTR